MNANIMDSTAGPWLGCAEILCFGSFKSALCNLNKFRQFTDSVNSIGRISPNYNVAVVGIDVESLRPAADSPNGLSVRRFVKGSMDFVDGLLTSVQQTSSVIPDRFIVTELSESV